MKNFEIVYVADVEKFVKEHRAVLIDIRDHEEYIKGHWPGAVNIPYNEMEQKMRIPANRYLVLYCEHGGGSMQMAKRLGEEGYRVATVIGGYEAMKKVAIKKVPENYFKNPWNV